MTTPLPPGTPGLPLIGETISFLRSPQHFAVKRRTQHGPVFRTHLFGNNAVYLSGPEANRWIFSGEGRYVKNRWTPAIRRLLGARSMAMLEGEAHRTRRTLLMPHFTRASVEGTASMIEATTRRHLEQWERLGELRLVPALKTLTFEIATRFLVGTVSDEERASLSHDFDVWTQGFFALPIDLPGTTFHSALKGKTRLMNQIRSLVERKAKERTNEGDRHDVLTSLLGARDETGQALDVETIADELHLMFFAGHDTTVTATTNALIHLALYPEVLERARREQNELGEGPMTHERIHRAEWLTQTLNESMRVIPPIAGAFRVTTENTSYGGYTIPEGWTVVLSPVGSHQDPDEFVHPETFDPSRFDKSKPENKRSQLAFIPFGGGPRVCIGQHFAMLEMQIMLALFVRDFAWQLKNRNKLAWEAVPFPRPKDGGRVTWQRRAG
jgi:cytochrome P450